MCAAVLIVIALVLEVGGLLWTAWDIRRARRNLLAYFHRDRPVYPSAASVRATAYDATVDTGGVMTLAERVEKLESWRRSLPGELDRRDREVTAHLEGRLQGDVEATRRSVETQLRQVNEYLEGGLQSAVVSYRGPVMLLAGVIAGFSGNLVALA